MRKYGREPAAKRTLYTVNDWLRAPDGTWLPKGITKEVYVQQRGGTEELRRIDRTEIVSADVNIPVGDSVFKLDLPASTKTVPFPGG